MPGLDGLELCKKIRERTKTPYTYFILLTSQETRPENYDLATDAGVDDFLTKPVDRPTIRMRLRVAERIIALHHGDPPAQGPHPHLRLLPQDPQR